MHKDWKRVHGVANKRLDGEALAEIGSKCVWHLTPASTWLAQGVARKAKYKALVRFNLSRGWPETGKPRNTQRATQNSEQSQRPSWSIRVITTRKMGRYKSSYSLKPACYAAQCRTRCLGLCFSPGILEAGSYHPLLLRNLLSSTGY
jgi:hypothetical protein